MMGLYISKEPMMVQHGKIIGKKGETMNINLQQIERDQLLLAMIYERNSAILNLNKQINLLNEEIVILRKNQKEADAVTRKAE